MKAILTDVTKCIGCRECVIACKRINKLSQELPRRWVLDDGLSARNWTSIVEKSGRFVRKHCRHCLEPACASVCPVAALQKKETGAVVYDSVRCMGCRYCMMSCPYGIPRYDWESRVPTVRKCIMCNGRLEQGLPPACVETCPQKATIFGEREELLRVAYGRIKENPNKYIHRVWGEKEVGGVCVLYIADINLDFLTNNQPLSADPLPKLTARAMEAVPYTFLGMGLFLSSLHWIIQRRRKLEKKQNAEKEASHE